MPDLQYSDPETAALPPAVKDASPRRPKGRLIWQIGAVVASIAITIGIFLLRDQLTDLAVYGYPGIFLISLIGNATLIFPAPTFVVAFAAGVVLNPWLVGITAGLGAALGELTGYLAGIGGRAVIENRTLYDRVEGWMQSKGGVLVIFVLAAVPNPLFDVGGIVAGALRMPVWHFLLACWAGKSVRFIALAFLGASLEGLLTRL